MAREAHRIKENNIDNVTRLVHHVINFYCYETCFYPIWNDPEEKKKPSRR